MTVGSIKENINIERRVAITLESAKNIIALGLNINLEKNYANHLGINDKQFEELGVRFYDSSSEVIDNSRLLLKVNCPSDEEIKSLKDLKDSKIFSDEYLVKFVEPADFQVNKFFYKGFWTRNPTR